jgi:branched-chain amino acid transport system ATP-binding protein
MKNPSIAVAAARPAAPLTLGLARPWQLACAVLALALACGLALSLNSYYVFVIASIALTAIVGIGLNVLLGLTGQVSFGHVGC